MLKYILILLLFTTHLNAINLTVKEKLFIKNHQTITLGTDKTWAPYVIEDSDGTMSGYNHDILQLINKATGANFVQKIGQWSQMIKLAKEKKLDGLSTLISTNKRKEFFNFSNIYISLRKIVLVKEKNPQHIHSAKDLDGKTIVIHKSNEGNKVSAKQFPNSKIVYADTVKEMVEKVIFGEGDALFANISSIYSLSTLGFPSMGNAFALNESLDLRFAIRKDFPEAISIINKGLSSISQYEKMQLVQKWFYNNNTTKIKLTKEELSYLDHKKKIRVCIDPSWMPFESFDKNGKHIGLAADYFKIFRKKLHIPLEVIKTKNWTESLEYTKNRKCDILSLAMQTAQRKEYLNFTSPYLEIPLVLATKLDKRFVSDFRSLTTQKIGIPKGYAFTEILKIKYPNLNIIEVDNIDDGLSRVAEGKLFGYIGALASVGYKFQKEFIGELKIAGKFDEKWELGVAVRDDDKVLLSIFEKIVLGLDSQTKQNILNNWLSIQYGQTIDYSLIWKILIFVLIGSVIFYFYQRKLNSLNANLEKTIKEEIKKSKDKDKLLFQQDKLASMGEMLANIAHQWRQPLAIVGISSGILKETNTMGKLTKDILEEELDQINLNISHMSQTIEDFATYFRPNKTKDNFLLLDAVDKAITIIEHMIKRENIDISININKSHKIFGFKEEYVQVIITIITNSIFALKGKENKSIQITSQYIKNNQVLTIADNAGGIPKDIIDRVFEPYFTTKHNAQGTGLGLYISKMIIEDSMSGSLKVQNTQEGAKFSIEV